MWGGIERPLPPPVASLTSWRKAAAAARALGKAFGPRRRAFAKRVEIRSATGPIPAIILRSSGPVGATAGAATPPRSRVGRGAEAGTGPGSTGFAILVARLILPAADSEPVAASRIAAFGAPSALAALSAASRSASARSTETLAARRGSLSAGAASSDTCCFLPGVVAAASAGAAALAGGSAGFAAAAALMADGVR